MSKEKVKSLIYKKVQFNVGDRAKLKPIDGITQPSVVVIYELYPPDMAMVAQDGTEFDWVSTCCLDQLVVMGKKKTVVVVTGPPGEGMSYSTHSFTEIPATGICGRCGRALSAARSVACGYGPVCYKLIFGRGQPLTDAEKLKRQTRRVRSSKKLLEIDYSQLTDARKVFK